jgi:hypothetical protein
VRLLSRVSQNNCRGKEDFELKMKKVSLEQPKNSALMRGFRARAFGGMFWPQAGTFTANPIQNPRERQTLPGAAHE